MNYLKIVLWYISMLFKAPIFPYWGKLSRRRESQNSQILKDNHIIWLKDRNSSSYVNHMEMTGFYFSMILSYRVKKQGIPQFFRHLIFPTLRTLPNDTHASFSVNLTEDPLDCIEVNGHKHQLEYVDRIEIDHFLTFHTYNNQFKIIHTFFPTMNQLSGIEKIQLTNIDHDCIIKIKSPKFSKTRTKKIVQGPFHAYSQIQCNEIIIDRNQKSSYSINLKKGDKVTLYNIFGAYKDNDFYQVDARKEEEERNVFLKNITNNFNVTTPNQVINQMARMTKIRATESIIKTKNGLMHAPGGGSFYSAIWANDECEYANPLFPFLGYKEANESALNSFYMFMNYMDKESLKPLVSSVIAEGDSFWNGVKDRGDAAMFAYGASRFSLSYGSKDVALRLWKGIEWCIAYSLKHKNSQGVIESDSDELENRFESGKANLFTSSLIYDALEHAIYLAKELGHSKEEIEFYHRERENLYLAIEKYFGRKIEGYDTYQYYEGNHTLRAWISIPIVMGVKTRKKGTIEALLSPLLWTNYGVKTQAGKNTIWDRSTLYALRSLFIAGFPELGREYLEKYTNSRTLGSHVPYPIEAYPEGNQKHLSAESSLYLRIFTEGILGINFIGFDLIRFNINLPSEWNYFKIISIYLSNRPYDIYIFREQKLLNFTIENHEHRKIELITKGQFELNLSTYTFIHNGGKSND